MGYFVPGGCQLRWCGWRGQYTWYRQLTALVG